jgi:DNA-binding transcriptional LysR family regulator
VTLVDRMVNLIDEGMDVGIRIGVLGDSTLVAQPLGHIRRVVVASPKFLKRHGTPRQPKDLKKFNCVCLNEQARSWGPFHQDSRKIHVAVNGNLEFNQSAPAIDACAADAGFGLFFSYQVADLVKSGHLKIVLSDFEPPMLPISIVYPHARLRPVRTRIFIEWIKKDLKNFQP